MRFLKRLIRIIRGFLDAMQKDHVGAYAAQSAYFMMLSFIPFLILLLTLLQYTGITKSDIYSVTQALVPTSMGGLILGIIDEAYSKTAVTISLSAIATAWSAGKGFIGLMRGMNTIYHVKEHRNYVLLRLRSAIYTLVFVIAVVLSLVVLVFGNSIHEIVLKHLPFLAFFTGLMVNLKDVIALCYFSLVFMILYKFVPDRRVRLLAQAPGALFSALGWYLFSICFSIYVEYSPGLSNMYGSLTTLILTMLWLYFCMYILLLGAEINSYFEKQFRMLNEYRKKLMESHPDTKRNE